jgi:hypothetical protein
VGSVCTKRIEIKRTLSTLDGGSYLLVLNAVLHAYKSTDVSKGYIASSVRVVEEVEKETSARKSVSNEQEVPELQLFSRIVFMSFL